MSLHMVEDSQLQGHKLKAFLILAYHQCRIITVSTFKEKMQPKNMTFLGSAFYVLLLLLLLVLFNFHAECVWCLKAVLAWVYGTHYKYPKLTVHWKGGIMKHIVHHISVYYSSPGVNTVCTYLYYFVMQSWSSSPTTLVP